LRYFVDHWGRSSHIFSWELFNEFWYPDENRSKQASIQAHNRWIDEMGKYIKEYELKKVGRSHLRSVSTMRSEFPRKATGLKPDDTNVFDSNELDFASFHAYGRTLRESTGVKNDLAILVGSKIQPEKLVMAVHGTMQRMLARAPRRPVLCTEDFQIANPQARGHKNPLNPLAKMVRDYTDKERYDLFGIANWAHIMSGAAGTTMRYPSGFYEDEMYDHSLVMSKFAANVPWVKFNARPAHDQVSANRSDVLVMAMSDGDWTLAWLYHNVSFRDRAPIQPAITFKGLKQQRREVVWFDSQTAKEVKTKRVGGSPFTVKSPPFKGHIACIVRPVNQSPARE
jgi:hypothetical protein